MSKRIKDYSEERINARVNEGRIPILEPKRWVKDLTINVRYYLTQIQFDGIKIQNYFKKKEVAYAAI